jgi:hypothetical protein
MKQQRKAKQKQQISRSAAPPPKEVPALPKRLLGVSDTPDAAHPSWRLSLLDLEHAGSWSWGVMAETALQEIIAFVTQMERLTWTEIKAQITSGKKGGHRKHHAIPLDRLCPEAQRRLQDLRLDDLDELFRFRLGNKPRLWGVIHDGVFYPVWWDAEHKVYPTDPG